MADGDAERVGFVVSAATLDALGFSVADLADEDLRAVAIRAEHPEYEEALAAGTEADVAGHPVNPQLHLALHQVIAAQLWDNEPPEAWETAKRLLALGYERHEILHMLGRASSGQIFDAFHGREPDPAAYIAALQALPESWERERAEQTGGRSSAGPEHTDADRRREARRRTKASRKRNRRR